MPVQYNFYPWRPVCFAIGGIAGAASIWGAVKYAQTLGGDASYTTGAAAVVALGALAIPPAAKAFFRRGELWIGLGLVATLPLCAWFAFLAVAERNHLERIGSEKAREARVFAAMRAEEGLKVAKAKLTPVIEREEAAAKANRNCEKSPRCLTAISLAQQIRQEISEAEKKLVESQSEALSESPYKAPTWLLGAAVDLVGLVFIWAGLSGPWWRRKEEEKEEELTAGFLSWVRNLARKNKEAASAVGGTLTSQ